MSRRLEVAGLFIALILMCSTARAQCLDWAAGFGIPGNGVNGTVKALVVFDDGAGPALYAGGVFTAAGGVSASNIAKWNGAIWAPLGSGTNGEVRALAVYNDGTGNALYAAGLFSSAGGAPASRVAKWSGSAWSALGDGLTDPAIGPVNALAAYGSLLVAAGDFHRSGNIGFNRIAGWNGTAWVSLASTAPWTTTAGAMAYDSARQRVVLYSGSDLSTWEWDGGLWRRAATVGPPGRTLTAMAYDSVRGRTVLFGGLGNSDYLGDTWEWDGTVWAQVSSTGPMARYGHAMVYDSARGRVVVFGGKTSSGLGFNGSDETWEWDGTAWTNVVIAGPQARFGHAMAYDSSRARTVLYGGWNGSTRFAATWEYNGTSWTQVIPSGPGGRVYPAMTFDSARARTVLFGGFNNFGPFDETWEWNGTSWTQRSGAQPAARSGAVLAFDVAHSQSVLCGGLSGMLDTWTLNGAPWANAGGGMGNVVNALVVHNDGSGSKLYAAGVFRNVAGTAMERIARWNGTGWSNVGGGTDLETKALAVFNGSLYAGGTFAVAGGNPAAYIARWNGSAWSALGSGMDHEVTTMGVLDTGSGPGLFAAGSFTLAGGVPVNRVARWSGSAWTPVGDGFSLTGWGGVSAMASFDDGAGPGLFVGGIFETVGGLPSKNIAKGGMPCSPPVIVQQPSDQTAVFNVPVVFSITAHGSAPLTYQWRHNSTNVISGALVTGATTPTLTLYAWSLSDAGSYDVVVTNALGSITSDTVTLTVNDVGTGPGIVISTVMYPPEPVLEVSNGTYTAFNLPIGSPTNEASFLGTYIAPNVSERTGIVQWAAGQSHLVARPLTQAPGTPNGVLFADFKDYSAASDGRLVFSASLSGPGVQTSTNGVGIWYSDAEGTDLVARLGDPAPGLPSGTIFKQLNNSAGTPFARVSDSGTVFFTARVQGPSVPNTLSDWVWTRNLGAQMVAHQNDPAPGTSTTFRVLSPYISEAGNGQVGFLSDLNAITGCGVHANDTGIWVGLPGSLAVVAKTGDQVPGRPVGDCFVGVGEPKFNKTGGLAFTGFIYTPTGNLGMGIFYATTEGISPVCLPGQAAPGGPDDLVFDGDGSEIRIHAVNERGDVVFSAGVTSQHACDPDCPPTSGSFFRSTDGQLHPISLDNSGQLPGVPAGFVGGGGGVGVAALNNAGQVVLEMGISNGTAYAAEIGWTADLGLFPIAMPSMQIEVRPGEYRTLSDAFLASVYATVDLNTSTSLNDSGQTLFGCSFTDGSRGVFAAQFGSFLLRWNPCAAVVTPSAPNPTSGDPVSMTVIADTQGSPTYQWRKDGENLDNGAGISGVNTATLSIASARIPDVGAYSCVVVNQCGAITSSVANLTVLCPADYNHDGFLDPLDYNAFINDFEGTSMNADYNHDGFLDPLDYNAFINDFEAGC